MKCHRGTAGHGHRSRCPGHHVVIAAAMVGIIVADRTNDRGFVRDFRQPRHRFAKMNPFDRSRNRLEFPPDFRRRIRLGIKTLVVRGTAIKPDQDAIDRSGQQSRGGEFCAHSCRGGLQAKHIGKTKTQHAAEAELNEITSGDPLAVVSDTAHGSPRRISILRHLWEADIAVTAIQTVGKGKAEIRGRRLRRVELDCRC